MSTPAGHAAHALTASATLLVATLAIPPMLFFPVYAEVKKSQREEHNKLAGQFNPQLEQLQKLESALLQNKQKLAECEKKLNSKEFLCERMHNHESRVIVCIGPTGYGKSVVCHRFIGNNSSTDGLEECKLPIFNVAESGQFESETKELGKAIKKVRIINKQHNTEVASFVLSVVDTPGAFDSKGEDDNYNSQMAKFFKASGGVNMFCVFFRYGDRGDSKYKELLTLYTEFWGKEFWKHCVIIITKCDEDKRRKWSKGLPKIKNSIQKFLADELNVTEEIPMFGFGENNFAASVKQIFLSLIEEQSVYANKYQCDQIVSPIEELWNETNKMYDEYRALVCTLQTMSNEVNQAKEKGTTWYEIALDSM